MSQIALINFVRLKAADGMVYRFQNFHFEGAQYSPSEDIPKSDWQFVPFGFSGVTINSSGENSPTELVFPNNALVRSFIDKAVAEKWSVRVDTNIIQDMTAEAIQYDLIYSYAGQVGGATWKGDSLMLSISSILDAVTANIPLRNFDVDQVGPLPITGNLRL